MNRINFTRYSAASVYTELKFDDFCTIKQVLQDIGDDMMIQFVLCDMVDHTGALSVLKDMVKEAGEGVWVRYCYESQPDEKLPLPHEEATFCVSETESSYDEFQPIIPCTEGWCAIVLSPVQDRKNYMGASGIYMALGHNFVSQKLDQHSLANKKWTTAQNAASSTPGRELGRFSVDELKDYLADSPTLQKLVPSALANSCFFAAKQLLKAEHKAGLGPLVNVPQVEELQASIEKATADKDTEFLHGLVSRCMKVYESLKEKGKIEQVPEPTKQGLKFPTGMYLDRVCEQFYNGMQLECTDFQQYLMWFHMTSCLKKVYLAYDQKRKFVTFYPTYSKVNSAGEIKESPVHWGTHYAPIGVSPEHMAEYLRALTNQDVEKATKRPKFCPMEPYSGTIKYGPSTKKTSFSF